MEKEQIKKLNEVYNFISSFQKSKIISDYDTGLLNKRFLVPAGDAEMRFAEAIKNLGTVYTRLIKYHLDNPKLERPSIVDDIKNFLDNINLPSMGPRVEDWIQKEGRIINIERSDINMRYSCPGDPIIFDKTINRMEKEQLIALSGKAERLYSEGFAYLKSITWHREDLIEEV